MTQKKLFALLINQLSFIKYVYQDNAGKHVAFNQAMTMVNSEFIMNLDSDDTYLPTAIEDLVRYWDAVEDKSNFVGVTGLCQDRVTKAIIGDRYPSSPFDSNSVATANISGDKLGMQKASILKQYPFPVFDGEKFMAEGVVWREVAIRYQTRYINDIVAEKEYLSQGLTKNLLRLRIQSPRGTLYYYQQSFRNTLFPWKYRIKDYLNFARCYYIFRKLKVVPSQNKPHHLFMWLF